jgi:membrane protease YdiL (CAAX protease family)
MKRLEGIKQKYETFAEEHPVVATLGETAVLFALRQGLEKGAGKAGLPLGHGRRNNTLRNDIISKHPILAAGAATVLAPIGEELLYRQLPAYLLEKKAIEEGSLIARKAKLGVAAIFAASHAGPNAIPIPQFIGGLNYSRIHEKRGLKYAILAHVTNNTLAAAKFALKNKK